MSKGDQNDALRAGTLPDDPLEGTELVADDVPHVLSDGALLEGARARIRTPWNKQQISTTGHYELDRLTGGPRKGFCWLLGAESSWGKSSFAVMLADDNMRQGKTVLIVSSEDGEDVYGDRLLQRRARISADSVRARKPSANESAAIDRAVEQAAQRPIFIDAMGRSVEWLAPRLERCIAEHNVDIVIFDYVGTFAAKERQQDRRITLMYIGRVLTDVVKRAKIAGVLMSQLTDTNEGRRPNKNSIRDCRDLAHAAEVVLIGWIPEKDIKGIRRSTNKEVVLCRAGQRALLVDKNKTGPRGALIELPWNEHSACFDSTPDPELEAQAATDVRYDNE